MSNLSRQDLLAGFQDNTSGNIRPINVRQLVDACALTDELTSGGSIGTTWIVSSPSAGEIAGARIPVSGTASRIDAYCVNGTSVELNVETRSTIGVAGTKLNTSNLTATTSGASNTSLNNPTLTAGYYYWLNIVSVVGNVSQLIVSVS